MKVYIVMEIVGYAEEENRGLKAKGVYQNKEQAEQFVNRAPGRYLVMEDELK